MNNPMAWSVNIVDKLAAVRNGNNCRCAGESLCFAIWLIVFCLKIQIMPDFSRMYFGDYFLGGCRDHRECRDQALWTHIVSAGALVVQLQFFTRLFYVRA